MGTSSKGANNAPSDKELTKTGGPWMPLQDPLKRAIGQTETLYNQGAFNPQYGPSVVPDFNQVQWNALNGMVDQGNYGQDQLWGAFQNASNIAGGGAQSPNIGFLNSIAQNGINSPAYGQLNQALQGAMGNNLGYAQNAAAGNYMNNPYLESQIQAAKRGVTDSYTGSVMPGIEGRMSMSGRLGSGSEDAMRQSANQTLSQNLGEIETGMRGAQYQFERGNQQQAGMALPGLQAQQTGNQIGAAQALNQDVYGRLGQQMQAAGQGNSDYRADLAAQMNAANTLGNVYGNTYMPYQQQLQAGNQMQDQQGRQLAEQNEMFQTQNNRQYDALSRYLQLMQGSSAQTNPNAAAQYYLSQTGGPSGTEVAMSNASQMAAAAAMAAAASDERLKTDIRFLRQTAGGHRWYQFRFRGNDELHEGVMAQEVRETRPDLVHDVDGVLYVDYGGIE